MKAFRRLGTSIAFVCFASVFATGGERSALRLVEAVKQRQAAAVPALLTQQLDVNAAAPDGATALHWAAHWNDLDTADLLIRAGAKANVPNDYGVTALFLAASNGSAAMLQKLLNAGASAVDTLPTGETALMAAARSGSVDAVTVLLARGADVNAKQISKGQTALMWAVSEHHVDVARTLIERAADVKARSKDGFSALLFAAREGDLETARLLLARGANVNESAADGSTPLLVATVRGHVPLATLFLEQGANPDGNVEVAGYTPLHWAAGQFESVMSLDYPSASGEWSALAGIPSREGKLALIDSLLSHGARIEAQLTRDPPRYGYSLFRRNYLVGATPFYLATLVADVEVMRVLHARGANPLTAAKDKTTPLMVAAGITKIDESRIPESAHLGAVKLALEMGNDIEAMNSAGWRAMHAAAFAGYDSVVEFLAAQGAMLSEENREGQTPLGIAEGYSTGFFQQQLGTAAILRKLGAVSKGAVTLQSFTEGKAKRRSETREFGGSDAGTGTQQSAAPGSSAPEPKR